MNNELQWTDNLVKILYACSTCGNCIENCRFEKFNDFLVDIIETARAEAVKEGFCPENQENLLTKTINEKFYNPYGESNSDNEDLKRKYKLGDKAEWVYFIGCTSNYRQKELRNSTLELLKKMDIDFTLIDEHCCTSPLIRTGQIEPVQEFMNYNLQKIKEAGASKVITSCAGCYRTLKIDFEKHGVYHDLEIMHTIELIKDHMDQNRLTFKEDYKSEVTYHDPCHVGRHMGLYEGPREVIKKIPGIRFVEMERNRENAFCCGAGGGVKIGFPDWSVEISKERLEETKKIDVDTVLSICPFCKTNLGDANKQYNLGYNILDIIEVLNKIT
jgi:heterodisulfide reductase subunit D